VKKKKIHFSKNIKKQKKALKIYGKTEIDSKIFILLSEKEYVALSGKD